MRRKCLWKGVLWVLVLLTGQVHSGTGEDERGHYVTCHFEGQLGNQIFQVATTLSYAWDHNLTPVFPELNETCEALSYNRDHIFFRLNSSCPPVQWTTFQAKDPASNLKEIKNPGPLPPPDKDWKLAGYFQSTTYFHHHRDELLKVFAPSQKVLDHLYGKYRGLIENPKTVGVHVRTYSASGHCWLFPFVGLEYYRRAMELFPPDSLFVVFSDRPLWCRAHFPSLGKQCIVISGNSAIEDLFLMSMMKHNIIANSSFSWWGAYLNQNPERLVVAPTWSCSVKFGEYPTAETALYLEDWKLVEPDYEAPYPQDMTHYDLRSQSLCEQ